MKTITITALLLGLVLGAYTQDLIVHKTDGTTASFPLNTIDSITFGVSSDIPVSLIDERDRTEYPIVRLGSQIWMAENLSYLPAVSPVSEGASDAVHYYVYDYNGTSVSEAKETENYELYGVLYNWEAALSACPEGWHLPDDTEWQQLEMFLGMSSENAADTDWRGTDEGSKLKASSGWYSEGNGTDDYGFGALPGGRRHGNGSFLDLQNHGWWQGAPIDAGSHAWKRSMSYSHADIYRFNGDSYKAYGYSIRCIKD